MRLGDKKFFYLDPDDRKWTMEDLGLSWDSVVHTSDRKNAIEGTFLMKNGQIFEWSELLSRCMVCLDPLAYNEEYDSEFCMTCDEWREYSCSDPNCEYCLARPERPSNCRSK